jgi:hypothetical protein
MRANREETLGQVAVAAGHAWVHWWRAELARQGRPMSGGWPGTLSEARRRVLAHAVSQLGADGALSDHELTDLARTVFATARADWIANAVREAE